MNERVVPGPVQDSCGIREAVCIHTKKIYDSCRDKDCIEDLRVYPTRASQAVIDRALSVRGGRAELLQAYIDVEPASYNRGFYSVDIRYYYRITAEAFVGGSRPAEICAGDEVSRLRAEQRKNFLLPLLPRWSGLPGPGPEQPARGRGGGRGPHRAEPEAAGPLRSGLSAPLPAPWRSLRALSAPSTSLRVLRGERADRDPRLHQRLLRL